MNKILKNLLAGYGYNLVALPKADIKPLLLLCQDKNGVTSLGNDLQDLFAPVDDAPPQIYTDVQVADVAGSAAVSYDSETGFSVLDWLLNKLNLGKLEGKINTDSNKVLTIKYENVLEDKIKLLNLDAYLNSADPRKNKFSAFQARLENGELYVVSSVLKSNAFTVSIQDKSGAAVDIQATIKGVLSASENIKSNSDNSITIKNDKETPLIFAFKAQHILYNKTKWWQLFSPVEAGFTIDNAHDLTLRDESNFPSESLKVLSSESVTI